MNTLNKFVIARLKGGELFERLLQESVGLCEAQSRRVIRQILEAVRHLHQNNLVHLDIKVSARSIYSSINPCANCKPKYIMLYHVSK